jgi:hypothetical protein
VTAIETTTAEVTVRVVDPWIEPRVALMVAEPVLRLLVRPEGAIWATALFDESQETTPVRSCVLPSE